MPSAHTTTPPRILSDLLASHPEAPSLLAEASHRQALAAQSAAAASQAFETEQAARVRCEELRHRLDPRGRRPMHFGTGLVLLAAMGAILAVLDGVELITVLTPKTAIPTAIAATAVWLTGAWLAALATRERRRDTRCRHHRRGHRLEPALRSAGRPPRAHGLVGSLGPCWRGRTVSGAHYHAHRRCRSIDRPHGTRLGLPRPMALAACTLCPRGGDQTATCRCGGSLDSQAVLALPRARLRDRSRRRRQ